MEQFSRPTRQHPEVAAEAWELQREPSWDLDAVVEDREGVSTEEGVKGTSGLVECRGPHGDPPMDAEGQQLMWEKHVLLQDLKADVCEVYTDFDKDCSPITRLCGKKGNATMVIAGATILVEGTSFREQGLPGDPH